MLPPLLALVVLSALWATIMRYETTPGRPADAPRHGRPNRFMVFVHPHCPCSRSTLGVLSEVLRKAPHLRCELVFVCPPGAPSGWERDDLWDQARALQGATLIVDHEARLATAMGVHTSGQALLYDARGRLLYSGGLTLGRGTESPALAQLVILPTPHDTPVFGCPLLEERCNNSAISFTNR